MLPTEIVDLLLTFYRVELYDELTVMLTYVQTDKHLILNYEEDSIFGCEPNTFQYRIELQESPDSTTSGEILLELDRSHLVRYERYILVASAQIIHRRSFKRGCYFRKDFQDLPSPCYCGVDNIAARTRLIVDDIMYHEEWDLPKSDLYIDHYIAEDYRKRCIDAFRYALTNII